MIQFILNKNSNDKQKWNRNKWIVFGLSLLVIPVINYVFPSKKEIYPKVNLAFYEGEGNDLKLIPYNNINMGATPLDIISNRLILPLKFALNNEENQPLQVEKVELFYPATIKVKSRGKPKIDPEQRVLIYEHQIGTLQNINYYTPLETIDTLEIPMKFFFTEVGGFFSR